MAYSNKELYEKLIEYETQSGYTLTKIAELVGVSRLQLSKFKWHWDEAPHKQVNSKLNLFFNEEPDKKFLEQNSKIEDLTGKKFNHWTVIKYNEEKTLQDGKNIYWDCKCDCGNQNIYAINSGNLKSGKSLGCLQCKDKRKIKKYIETIPNPLEDYPKITNIIGKKFNKLTVVDLDLNKTKKDINDTNSYCYWKVKCDCNTSPIFSIVGHRLGKTISCGCVRSKGEIKIAELLTNNNIYFEKEKTFNDCFLSDTSHLLRFDFYINNHYLIEFDGEQHFNYDNAGWNNMANYEITKQRDNIKNEYCKNKKIPLIRIPYNHLNNLDINDLLLETSNFIYYGGD